METGFDFEKIKAALTRAEWEADPDNPGTEVRRVWLGTIFGITPSGKFYTPFACSNVAGDCKTCGGLGTRTPRTGKRVRARAKRRQHDFARGVIARGFLQSPTGKAYADRVHRARDAASRATDLTCHACDGTGSRSAALDARWTEAMEQEAEKIGASLDYQDDSIFVAEGRDAEESSDDDSGDNWAEAPAVLP